MAVDRAGSDCSIFGCEFELLVRGKGAEALLDEGIVLVLLEVGNCEASWRSLFQAIM